MTDPLQRVLRASESLKVSGVPSGFLPWLAADLARAVHGTGKGGRAVIVAADEAAMRALADTVPVFAPDFRWSCRLAAPDGAVASADSFVHPVVPGANHAEEAPPSQRPFASNQLSAI